MVEPSEDYGVLEAKHYNMKTPILLLFSLVCVTSQAQTKIISHKSHSGSNADFNIAYANDLFGMEEDNLGMAPERRYIKEKNLHPKLDSVVFISKDEVKLYTSSSCKIESDYTGETHEEKWKPGIEIAKNHPLFSKQHSLDSIKKVLKKEYGFENPINEVVFVGYDNTNQIVATQPENNPETGVAKIQKVEKRKSRVHIDKSILVVLGLTLASFFSGMFMLNRNN